MDERRDVTLGEAFTMLAIMHELEPMQVKGAVVFTIVQDCGDMSGPHVHVLQIGLTDTQSLLAVNEGIGAIGD